MFLLNKKYFFVFVAIIFFAFSNKAKANLEISEINYNPEVKTNHLWIKIYNNSSTDNVDLTEWSVADYDGTSWHYHAINAQSSTVLPPNSYAIIAKSTSSTINDFINKNPDISDQIFYGNLTFENEGKMGLSKDKKTIVCSKSYGGSLDSSSQSNNISSSESNSNETSKVEKVPKKEEVYKITTKIISPKIVTAGIPFTIDHQTTGIKKEKVIIGKFIWNLGDGSMRKSESSDPFNYIYQYPGDYVVTLSFYNSIFEVTPDATDRITIKVIPSGIVISSVGEEDDSFIEIKNNSNYEMSLKDWTIKGSFHSFTIPDGTIILPNQKIKFSPKITGFNFYDLNNIFISDSSGKVFAVYPNKNTTRNFISNNFSKNIPKNTNKNEDEIINLDDLDANAVSSDNNSNRNIYTLFGLFVIISVGVISVILMKKKKDYLDYPEEINSKDIKIIE